MEMKAFEISEEVGGAVQGYYCLIQYSPDPARLESINQGVLLFCPELQFLRCATSNSTRRLEKAFGRGSFDAQQVRFAVQSLVDRLEVESARFETADDLRRFIDTRAGQIVLSQPRPVSITSPDGYLESLFGELVGGGTAREGKDAGFKRQVREFFQIEALAGKLKRDYKLAIKPEVVREFPYAYQNGSLNCIRPVRFSADPKAIDAALRCGGEAVEIGRASPAAQLVVIGGFGEGEGAAEMKRSVGAIFNDFSVRLVGIGDLGTFADEIARTAHS